MAADFSAIESAVAEQQLELTIDTPELSISQPTNNTSITKAGLLNTSEIKPIVEIEPNSPQIPGSASIAKARLLGTSKIEITDLIEPDALKIQGSANIAKARLHKIAAKESHTAIDLKTPLATNHPSTSLLTTLQPQSISKNTTHMIPRPIMAVNEIKSKNNQTELNTIAPKANGISQKPIEQRNIASASSELNDIKQWELHKSVTLDDILLTPNPVPTIAQAPARLPDNPPILKAPKLVAPVLEAQKPAITTPTTEIPKPSTTIIETQKPTITAPTASAIETKKPAPIPQNNEPKKWAVGVHTQFSTTGFIGVDAGYKFSPNLHARLGLNTVGFNLDYASQGIDYKASFSPTNVHLLGDYFPFGGGLRLTGGLVFQSNQFNATGTPNSSTIGGISQVNIGGANYTIDQIGNITSEGSFTNSVAPYLGIGFGTPLSPGLGFNFDAGVMFAGSPRVKLRANIPASIAPQIQNDIRNSLAEQERRTNNDISSFGVYPVVSVGLSYAF